MMNKELLEYFNGDDLAASTWLKKYAAPGEETPKDMHRRMAKEFARIEATYSNPMNETEIFNLFDKFKYIIPGGSVMSVLGTENFSSLSNCTVLPPPNDKYSSIMQTREKMVQLYKRRCGVGIDLSELRPKGAEVKNSAKVSSGAASFMEGFSTITKEVAQDGRRGALMLSMDIRHPDSLDFIKSKQDLSKITGANISVMVTDDFIKAVENDEDYILKFPIDNTTIDDLHKEEPCIAPYNELFSILDSRANTIGYYKRVKAKELWDELMHCAWNTAEPGIVFKDTVNNYSPDGVYEMFKMVGLNPCQPKWATVLTPNGISTIGDINIGDKIWSSEGWTTVINKWSSGIKEVHEYRTTAGSFYGTENHRILSKGEKIEVKDAENIDVLAGNRFETPYFDLNPEDIMDGLVLGDGSVHKASNNLIYLCIGTNDSDYFTSSIKSLIGNKREAFGDSAYEVHTNILYNELPLTYLREIPERYFTASPHTVAGFLRGLYSANGSVVNSRVTLKTSSSKLRDQVQILLSSLGIRSYYTTNKLKEVDFSNGTYICKESYDINISTDRGIFHDYIGFLQEYKMDKLKSTFGKLVNSSKNHSIISDTIISTEEVFDITVDNPSHTYWTGGLNVSNCAEQALGPYDACRLLHCNLTSFVRNPFTKEAFFDFSLYKDIITKAVRLGDDLVDLEIEAMDKIINKAIADEEKEEAEMWIKFKNIAIEGRRIGLGFTGLADTLAMLNFSYDSEEALTMIDAIMSFKFTTELEASITLAKERGCFPKNCAVVEDLTPYDDHSNDWYKFLVENYPELYDNMMKHGRRNVSISTVAPVGTVSLMTQTSSGIEPVFMPIYERKRKCSSPEDRVDYTDINGEKFTKFVVVHPKLREWANISNIVSTLPVDSLNYWEDMYKQSPYYGATAPEIDWKRRIKLQGIIQKYTSNAISSTINLHKNTTKEEIADLYLEAWKEGLKGITIYRDGCREGILTSVGDAPTSINSKDAPKRPKELEADFYTVKVKGEQFVVLVGLLEGKPYEVFTFRPLHTINVEDHKGIITKKKKNHYGFNSEYISLENLQNANKDIEENAATLYASMLLRHGIDIPHITKVAKKVNDNISSFSSAMCRILNKYIKDGTTKTPCPACGEPLAYENGCIVCKNCSDYEGKCG